jgi:cytidyltransferase-like protein
MTIHTEYKPTPMLEKEKFGWINGTFDILHPGHLELFRAAEDFCHQVIVGIDSDRRFRERKGRDPIFSESDRIEMLAALWNVYTVVVFDSDDELREAIRKSGAKVIVVGQEYQDKVVGGEYAYRIVYVPRIKQFSTTKIIEKCRTMESAL